MKSGKHGDLSRFPSRALAIHLDVIAPQDETVRFARLRRLLGKLPRTISSEAVNFSRNTVLTLDYMVYVVAFSSWESHDGKQHSDALVLSEIEALLDGGRFVFSRVQIFRGLDDLREWLTYMSNVEAYYDVNEERVARVGLRSFMFKGWSKVGW